MKTALKRKLSATVAAAVPAAATCIRKVGRRELTFDLSPEKARLLSRLLDEKEGVLFGAHARNVILTLPVGATARQAGESARLSLLIDGRVYSLFITDGASPSVIYGAVCNTTPSKTERWDPRRTPLRGAWYGDGDACGVPAVTRRELTPNEYKRYRRECAAL